MLPERWQTVCRLLIVDCGTGDPLELDPALNTLRAALPQAEMTLLTPQAEGFEFSRLSAEGDRGRSLRSIDRAPHCGIDAVSLVSALADRQFDAAILLTAPGRSPYTLAYLCYLAGIPLRLGQSREFGGGVLSPCMQPPIDPVSPSEYHLHLLRSAGFAIAPLAPAIAWAESLP